MLRTHNSRPVGGASVLLLSLVLSLVVGLLGGSAQADDATPSDQSSDTTAVEPSDPSGTPAPAQTGQQAGDESSPGTIGELFEGLGGSPTVNNEYLPLRRGLTDSINLAANGDNCGPSGQIGVDCNFSRGTAPAGWGFRVEPNGAMTVSVPGATVPRAYQVTYNLTDTNGSKTTTGVVTVAVTPDAYNPPAGPVFSHPYRKAYRYVIRDRILRTINSVPPGAHIQVASWSFNSKTYRKALRRARDRGVSVQIVMSRHKISRSEFRRLRRIFGTAVSPTGSWVRRCYLSCRGTSGTMHSKIFLFSQVYRTPSVMMTGSANLTDFAVTNQWNQMNVTSGPAYQPVYDEGVRIFTEMTRDQPAASPYVSTSFPSLGITSFFYPHLPASPRNDYIMNALAPVRCTGATNTGKRGRTVVKIAMYSWYQSRGKWLAKRVRQLWNQGCQVQIVYAITSNPVKSILYSPSGRGRIPMRQILLTNKAHVPIYYIHDKWVAIKGHYGNDSAAALSIHGSFNFSDRGFGSDEQAQRLDGGAVYNRFAKDFKLLWTDRQARAPSPVSKIPVIEGRYSQDDLRLGTGVYRYMDAD